MTLRLWWATSRALEISPRRLPLPKTWLLMQSRTYNRRRNYYIEGASNETNITEEVRDLIRNMRTADNVDEWKRGHGIQPPITFSMKDPEDIDDDQTPDMMYYPYKGEVLPEKFEASPVLLVKRVKSLKGQPYWHKETCERLGIGEHEVQEKITVVPNMPTMVYRLFSVKHLIEIIPLKFPMGFPSKEEFDPAACKINHKGEFYYHPKLKVDTKNATPRTPMVLHEDTILSDCRKEFYTPTNSPLGNSNYHRNTTLVNRELGDTVYDQTSKIRFNEDIKKFSRLIK